MDMRFKIWKFSFGIDPLIGIVPVVGDILPGIASALVVYAAILYKVRLSKILLMILYIGLDFWAGSLPLVGNIFDFAIRSNLENIKILEKEILPKTK